MKLIHIALAICFSVSFSDPSFEGPIARDVKPEKAMQIIVGESGGYYVGELTKETEVTINGKKAELKDLKKGYYAKVYEKKNKVIKIIAEKD